MRVAIPVIRREIGPDEWNAFVKENTGAPFSCLGNEEEHGLSGTYFINPDSSLWEKMGTGAIDIEITMLLILNGEKNTGSSKFFICKGARNLIQVDKAEFEKQRAYFESVAKNGSAPVNR